MEQIETRTVDAIRIIQYANLPRHLLTVKGAAFLSNAVQDAIDDEAIRAIILTGSDDIFIRHYDVEAIVKAGDALAANVIDETAFADAPFAALTKLVANAPKPVIAAINGTCMGGGFELALACDIRIASRDVDHIGLPETRLNIFPGGGGTQRLPRLIGEAAALRFIMLGSAVDAAQALEIGLVHELADDAMARAKEFAAELTAKSPASLAAVKQLVRGSLSRPLEEGLNLELQYLAQILRDPQAMAAMRAFCDSADQDILKSRDIAPHCS